MINLQRVQEARYGQPAAVQLHDGASERVWQGGGAADEAEEVLQVCHHGASIQQAWRWAPVHRSYSPDPGGWSVFLFRMITWESITFN